MKAITTRFGKKQLKLKKLRKDRQKSKLDFEKLKAKVKIKEEYISEIRNSYQALAEVKDADKKWNTSKKGMTLATKKACSSTEKKPKQKWMIKEI